MSIRSEGSSSTQFASEPSTLNKLADEGGDYFGKTILKPLYDEGVDYAKDEVKGMSKAAALSVGGGILAATLGHFWGGGMNPDMALSLIHI